MSPRLTDEVEVEAATAKIGKEKYQMGGREMATSDLNNAYGCCWCYMQPRHQPEEHRLHAKQINTHASQNSWNSTHTHKHTPPTHTCVWYIFHISLLCCKTEPRRSPLPLWNTLETNVADTIPLQSVIIRSSCVENSTLWIGKSLQAAISKNFLRKYFFNNEEKFIGVLEAADFIQVYYKLKN